MKELRELAFVLNQHQVAKIEIIGDLTRKPNSKMALLYEAVRKKEVKTDEEAAFFLYGEKEISTKYRNLKFHLKKRLLNTLFFIEPTGRSEKNAAHIESWKQWAACALLSENYGNFSITKLAEKVLNRSIKFEHIDLIVLSSRQLRSIYGLRHKDKKKFDYYNSIYHQYRKIEDYQNKAHEYYTQLITSYTLNSVVPDPKIKEDAQKYYAELAPLKNEIDDTKFVYFLNQIQLLGAMGTFDYARARDICEEGIQHLNTRSAIHRGGIRNFLLNKLVCHIQLREYQEGKNTATECEKHLDYGSFNWFKAKEFLFMLSIHTQNYQEAYEAYFEVTNHERYNNFKKILHEMWVLYHSYLHFLIQVGKVVPHKDDTKFNNIRLGRFLNQVPGFSKDKRGMNVPVLIVQLIFLILQQKYDLAEERIDALGRYCSRYLKEDDPNFRGSCFIKMLLQIPKYGFERKRVKEKAQKYLTKMENVSINFSNQSHEVEVMPFPDTWNFILGLLK